LKINGTKLVMNLLQYQRCRHSDCSLQRRTIQWHSTRLNSLKITLVKHSGHRRFSEVDGFAVDRDNQFGGVATKFKCKAGDGFVGSELVEFVSTTENLLDKF
jgi:hypothetical protein